MEFILADESDAEVISQFIHDVWVDTYAPIIIGGRVRAESIFDDWVGPMKIRSDMSHGYSFWFIWSGGERIGVISSGRDGDDYIISKMYMLPQFRGKGAGSEAMRFLLEDCRRSGCRRAVLEVNPRNYSAIEFYKSNGFEEVGRNQYVYGYTLLMGVDVE
jgi:ribosomal protein S18 acetylase RimI-like enzyme